MTRTIGIGVIGMGWMGEVHSRSYRAIPDRFYESGIRPRLVMCADQVEARAQGAQERFSYERYTTDWHEVIADPEVEVIDIAAPNGMHLEIIREAARAGKPILCEKPVGKDPQETIESFKAAQEAGVLTFVGYNYRWAPVGSYAGWPHCASQQRQCDLYPASSHTTAWQRDALRCWQQRRANGRRYQRRLCQRPGAIRQWGAGHPGSLPGHQRREMRYVL